MDSVINPNVIFSWFDYGLFLLMLGCSILIGLYFGCCGHQDSAEEYLLGSKSMSVIPISISLVASFVSGIMLLAVPADIYRFGIGYFLIVVPYLPIFFITCYIYLPVFYKLQLVSTYEYLMLRFDRKIRVISSALYAINTLFYLPIVIYIPALALAQATQINIHIVTPIVCCVCIFYTTIGGLKAVVWTDTLQFVVMIGSIMGVLFMGVKTVGGFENIWTKSVDAKRIYLDFDIDPTKRDPVITVVIGTLFSSLSSVAVNQSFVQKYLSLPKFSSAKKAVCLFLIGLLILSIFVTLTGLIMFTRYYDCEPFAAGKIKTRDQILPYFVLDVAGSVPGLAGLFLSGIFSAGLSTLSACMNCLSGTLYEDFVSPYMPKDITPKRVSDILKVLVVIVGVLSTVFVFVIEQMGSILPINYSLSGITNGPLLGLFTLGMVFPQANAKGAFYGSLGAMGIMSYIIIGSQLAQQGGHWTYEDKPFSIEGCLNTTTNATFSNFPSQEAMTDINPIFKISFYYYCALGTVLTVIIGVIVSHFTKDSNHKVDRDLISPVSHWMIKEEKDDAKYLDINNALKKVVTPEKP